MSKVEINRHFVEISCSKCSKKIKEAIGGLKKNPDVICPCCGITIHIDTNALGINIKDVQKPLGILSATFKTSSK